LFIQINIFNASCEKRQQDLEFDILANAFTREENVLLVEKLKKTLNVDEGIVSD
jgi:hypothetical protein